MTQITLQANHCWIDTTPKNFAKDYGKCGIYIWGIKNWEGRILPYYVGQTSGNFSKYLEDIFCKMKSTYTTRTIFSENFLRKKRGTKSDFIKRIKLPSSKYPISAYGDDILYLNDPKFFGNSKVFNPHSLPLNIRKGGVDFLFKYAKNQSLFNQVVSDQTKIFAPASLFFTLITFDKSTIEELGGISEEMLKIIETFVKFSLRINVISKSEKSFEVLEQFLKSNQITLNIKCPEIDQEFHSGGNRPTDVSTILFP